MYIFGKCFVLSGIRGTQLHVCGTFYLTFDILKKGINQTLKHEMEIAQENSHKGVFCRK